MVAPSEWAIDGSSGGRDLIEERLKKVVVALIYNGDVYRLAGEALTQGSTMQAGE